MGNGKSQVRYSWKETQSTTPSYALTKYTFTGQYSYMDDPSTAAVTEGFGLMFYNARWYDPSLGRFAQADTIVPQHQGVQAWDRYAYVNNNPVMYTDPTGHVSVDCYGNEGYCGGSKTPTPYTPPQPNGGGGGGGGGSSDNSPDDRNKSGSSGGCHGVLCSTAPKNDAPHNNYEDTTYLISEQNLVMLSTQYDDLSDIYGTLALLDGVAGIICLAYCQGAILPLAIVFILLGNESIQAQNISDALDDSATWASQQDSQAAHITFSENQALGIFDVISYTDDLGYQQADTTISPIIGSHLQQDLETYNIPLPLFIP